MKSDISRFELDRMHCHPLPSDGIESMAGRLELNTSKCEL